MNTYVIGDIQGCFDEFQDLLNQLNFNAGEDKLWLTGDLVNRGPKSLEVLRFVKSLGDNAIVVLGNHDLHLLAVACGHGKIGCEDTLDAILGAPDRDELLYWLRHRLLCHYDSELGYLLIHAGLPPQWNLAQTLQCANEVEQILQGQDYLEFFANMYGNFPSLWQSSLRGWDRTRFITNSLTRLRYVEADGRFCLSAKGPLGTQPHGCIPWFQSPNRKTNNVTVVFGHWSTLGYLNQNNVISLDTGCLWGGALTAVRLSSHHESCSVYQIDCKGERKPIAH